jgi:hypothetical protein
MKRSDLGQSEIAAVERPSNSSKTSNLLLELDRQAVALS